MRVSSVGSLGPGALGAICEGLGDPTPVDPIAGGHRRRLGRSVARDVGTRSSGRGVRGRSPPRSMPVPTRSSTGSGRRTRPRPGTSSTGSTSSCSTTARVAQNEYDVYAISWEVKPRIALAAIDLMRRSDASQAPTNRNTAAIAERDRVAADIRAQIAGDPETAGLFEAAMTSARLFLSGRERAKTNVVTVINEMRVALREFGRRLVERGVIDEVAQVFMVTDAELNRLRHDPDSIGRSDPRSLGRLPVAVRLRAGVRRQRRGPRALRHAPTGRRGRRRGGRRHRAHGLRRLGRRRDRTCPCDPRCCRPARARARRHPRGAADRPLVGAVVRARLRRGGQRRRDGQPRDDRVARTRRALCRLGRRCDAHHSRRRDHHRRRQRRHGHDRRACPTEPRPARARRLREILDRPAPTETLPQTGFRVGCSGGRRPPDERHPSGGRRSGPGN